MNRAADWSHYLFLSTLAIFAPIKPVMIAVGFLVFADTVTGVMAARKRGETISSGRLGRTVTKMFVYQSVVVTGFVAEKYLIGDAVAISKLAAGFIGLVETKSVWENLNVISGTNLIRAIADKLSSPNQERRQ